MIIVPARGGLLIFDATEKVTLVFPLPGLPPVTVIHGVWLTAEKSQFGGALMLIVPCPPKISNDCAGGEKLKLQTV